MPAGVVKTVAMKKEFSIYLDALRFFAAVLVFLNHSNIMEFPSALFTSGHEAVMIFFVLSGFVIAYVTDAKEKTLRDYALSRIARVYSVALPAVILTLLVDRAGLAINAAGYPATFDATDFPLVRFVSSLTFTNELWFVSIQSFSNHPYWSLNYEVWYYAGFACLAFFTGPTRWILFGAVALIAGIKIALLAPIWWAGVWCYRTTIHQRLSWTGGWTLVGLSLAGIFAYFRFGLEPMNLRMLGDHLDPELYVELGWSKRFLSDYVLAAFVVAHFIGMRRVAPALKGILVFETQIRWLAGYTFALYLFHVPLLLFFRAVFDLQTGGAVEYAAVAGSALVTIFVLGSITERQKGRVKAWASTAFDLLGRGYSRIRTPA